MKAIIAILSFIFVFTVFVPAQTKQITSREFYEANSKAYRLMNSRSWRMSLKTDTLESGQIVKSISKIQERLLPDRSRFLSIEKIGDKETKLELIFIGSMEYRRENDNPWTSRQLSNGTGLGNGIGGSVSCIQYTEELVFVQGITARKLQEYTIGKTEEGLSFDDMSIWIDENGLFLKTERIKGLLEPRVEKTRSIANYEYDPKDLKIEAPIK